ncbi:EamA family transporter [Aliiroseovarius sp. 2305UL8-7]|uniref:EamA family transporter n=1 Tax=Aliiroseovarius conchicola TaxID=3121637 RepID=UPI003526CA1E
MNAITLGLIAALCWGIHDVTIRKLSQSTPLMATLLGVLSIGAIFQIIAMGIIGGIEPVPTTAIMYSMSAGVAFLFGSMALYGAFHRGPVRIVAPVIGSFPILSVAFASLVGAQVSLTQLGAVLLVVAGIAIVSVFSHAEEDHTPAKGPTIALSVVAAIGFATTFALGQEAARIAQDLPTILITRMTGVLLLVPILLVLSLPLWPGRKALPYIIVLGILDGIALLLVLSAGNLPSAHYASVASSIFGLITIILAWLFLKEKMTPSQWLGCILAFAGIGYLAT